jgi:neutral/alkaline ceramidase-like enzyme
MAAASEYQAGVARIDITPSRPIRMAGYAARENSSNATASRLWLKALAMEDRKGKRVVLVTSDLIGLPQSVSDVVGATVEKKFGLTRNRLLLNSSHTHAGPIVWSSDRLAPGLSDEQKQVVMQYRNTLVDQLVSVVGAALGSMAPAEIQFGSGEAHFAVNRRMRVGDEVKIGVNPSGPSDQSVPVLKVTRPDNSTLAIVFGYACHNTTLGSDNLAIDGDYAGKAQSELEKHVPNATAMFLMLCGGDQNPNPRASMEDVAKHGEALAAEVKRILGQKLDRVTGPFATALQIKDLALAEPLSRSVPYPVQAVRFGKSLTLIGLGGEVVVDYALRIKLEFPKERLIVAAYSNDVMAYIPTAAMLKEGGYEPVTSMRYYGFSSPFASDVEERVMSSVREVLRRVGVR